MDYMMHLLLVSTTYLILAVTFNIQYLTPTPLVYAQQGVQDRITYDESSWSDPLAVCVNFFECERDTTTGWNDNASMRLSTTLNRTGAWSWIYGNPINDTAGRSYNILSHVRLNDWATQSHVVAEGFNETSGQWYQIWQCPSGLDGPREWSEFNCQITAPEDTTMIKPALAAGWSSRAGEEAITWFDDISMISLDSNVTSTATQGGGSNIPLQPSITAETTSTCSIPGILTC